MTSRIELEFSEGGHAAKGPRRGWAERRRITCVSCSPWGGERQRVWLCAGRVHGGRWLARRALFPGRPCNEHSHGGRRSAHASGGAIRVARRRAGPSLCAKTNLDRKSTRLN